MERTKYILILTFICLQVQVFGQIGKSILNAFISGNMMEWETAMDSFHAITNAEKLELINYQYGFIAYCIYHDRGNEAEKYMHKAENLLAELEKQQYNLSMIYAYKSAFVGFKIGLSPYKAPLIGNQSLAFAKESIAFDGANYFGYIQLGNIAFYSPSMFGGSKSEAINHYMKALELIELKPEFVKNNWNYLNLLATIINANIELKQFKLAKIYCVKTLAIEPEFDWVKNRLYPKIQKQLNDE